MRSLHTENFKPVLPAVIRELLVRMFRRLIGTEAIRSEFD